VGREEQAAVPALGSEAGVLEALTEPAPGHGDAHLGEDAQGLLEDGPMESIVEELETGTQR
jgi:hypothetical protein